MIEPKYLRLVDAILREGTLTRAAIHLHLSQSAASCQLKELETRLGGKLFRRQGRSLIPGDAARRMQAAAQRILPELDSLGRELEDLLQHRRSTIRIATECSTAYHWLTPVLRRLRTNKRFAEIQVDMVPEARWHPIQALFEGRLDLAITPEAPKDKRLLGWPLVEDELMLLVPAGHPLSQRRIVFARDFAGEHLITFDAPPGHLNIFKNVLYPAHVTPKRVSRVQFTEAILEMVSAGMGVTVMAPWLALPFLESGALTSVRISGPGMKRNWRLYALSGSPQPQLEFAAAVSQAMNKTEIPPLRRVPA
ncbi:MAG: LysR family transcriptional regulator [Bryobacteraceae bacterium]|nr:LysR family transcriptional regulator [Bryobacteraceae bacterium]